MATAATTSLCAALWLAGAAAGQSPAPAAMDWHPVAQPAPRPLPPTVVQAFEPVAQPIEPVQFKQPAPMPPQAPVQPPVQPPFVEKLPEPKSVGPGRIGTATGQRINEAVGESDLQIKTEPPGIDQLTRRQSEAQLQQEIRMLSDYRPGGGSIYFPEEEPVSREPFTGRRNEKMVRTAEPNYVCHKPLYFEQLNWERYGWELGPITPGLEVAQFTYDLLMLPYHFGADVCHCSDCSTGKCLPGDAVPLLCYRERFSVTGLVFEAGAVFGGIFVFP
jgi:hypothetical protein